MKHDYLEQFISLIPAPGWRAFGCFVQDGNFQFEEINVVGWAIVRTGQNDEDSVEILMYDGNGCCAYTRRWLDQHPVIEILPPGKEFDDTLKAQAIESLRTRQGAAA